MVKIRILREITTLMKLPFKSATMCSGIGSPEQSLAELGVPHKIVFACEKDKFARQTYLANFSPVIMYEDMTTEAWDLPEQYADLIIAGIPCQSFSLAGKRQGENDPRGLLIYDFIRYVKKQQPKVFIIENVKGLLSDAGGVTFSKWCELLGCNKNGQSGLFTNTESCGYNLHYRVLNAKHYGLPQNRERVFIIGIRPDLVDTFRWPKRVVLKDRLIDLLESEVDEKYYLSLEQLEQLKQLDKRRKEKGNGFSFRYTDGINDIASSITKSYCKMGGGDLILIQGARFEANRIYDGNGIAKTQKSNGGGGGTKTGYYKLKSGVRRLTPRESMRLQGFPDTFITPVSDTRIWMQAGNSIPVHMMKAILKQLLPILTS